MTVFRSCASVLSQKFADKVFPFRMAVPQPRQGRNPAYAGPGRQPWGKEPSPRPAERDTPLSPRRPGEGTGESEGSPTHG